MKKICSFLAGGLILVLAGSGCQPKTMDEATINLKADSVYAARRIAIMDSMATDCEANKAMWIQLKADSIYKADSVAMAMMQ